MWGLGVRLAPLVFAPPLIPDGGLSSAAVTQLWLTPQLAVEGGGWLSGYSDPRSESSLTFLTAGLLLKLFDAERSDFYLAGRGLHARQAHREKGVFFGEPPAPGPIPEEGIPCCPPMESESLTLALELAAGVEWSLSPQLAIEAELAFTYAQTATSQSWGPMPPPDEQTFTSISWGISLRLGIFFYFPKPEAAEEG